MNINEEIQKASDQFIQDKLPEMVQQKINSMMDDLLKSIFSSYSPMGKVIKEKIEQSLDVNLQKYDMVDYNALIAKAINDHLTECVIHNSIEPIMSLVKDTVGFVKKKKITLSEIHEKVIDQARESGDEPEGEISFHVFEDRQHDWTRVSIDFEKNKSADQCAVEFLISNKRNTIFHFTIRNWWNGKSTITPCLLMQISGLEHEIFRLYSAQVEIEIDETEFETEWNRYDD